MRKIRLLVDGHWFDDHYQSPCLLLKGLYSHITQDTDIDLFIAAYDIARLKREFGDSQSIQYVRLNSKSKYRRLSFELPKIIRDLKIDITHYQYISPIFKSAKEIVTIHDILYKDFPGYFPFLYRKRNDFFFKRSAARADLITTVSNYSRDSIIRHFNIPEGRIKLIPNGIGDDYYTFSEVVDVRQKYNLGDYILCVSRFEPRKNQLFLLKAYDELALKDQGIKLVFVGREDIAVGEFEQYISTRPGLNNHVVRLQNITFKELLSLYSQAKVSVYPSLAEGFGIPPLESAALLGPTLCSNATAMSDFDFFGEYLFDPNDLNGFKVKLMGSIANPNKESMKVISNTIRHQYHWSDIAHNFSSEVKKLF